MTSVWQIPRNALAWLVLTQFVLLLPHLSHLPWWVMLASICCALWRLMVHQGRWSLPPKFLKVALALLCFAGIYQSFNSFMGLEPTIALLFSGFALKLLEAHNRRDVYFLVFLAYFVASTAFLFSQEVLLSLYLLLCLVMITATLVALHQTQNSHFSLQSLRKAGVMIAQALPLMVLLFLVFPRLDPLWSVPLPSHQATTGVSDKMTPGDISQLAQSAELAFRVQFEGQRPPQSALYWRGMTLSDFDGRSWTQSRENVQLISRQEGRQLREQMQPRYRYQVIQEPSYQRWLFTLATAYIDERGIEWVSDNRWFRFEPLAQRIQYRVSSDPTMTFEPRLSEQQQQFYTYLPTGSNPRTRRYAQDLKLDYPDAEQRVAAVLKWFRQEAFFYTLKPPALGEHTADEFLFDTRRGFCEHYASAFVIIMRAAGIPARVVAGYQGGEVNPLTGALAVRQYDAHAWAEIWYEGVGWQRVDPTAAVSPARIESGLEEALRQSQEAFLENSPLSPLRYRNIAWIENLRLQWERGNYYWTKWVLNYEGESQTQVLQKLLGEVSATRMVMLVLLVGAGLLLLFAWPLMRGQRNSQSQQERLYLALCISLKKAGYERRDNEGALEFLQRVQRSEPPWSEEFQAITQLFMTLNYQPISDSTRERFIRQLRRDVLKLQARLLTE